MPYLVECLGRFASPARFALEDPSGTNPWSERELARRFATKAAAHCWIKRRTRSTHGNVNAGNYRAVEAP